MSEIAEPAVSDQPETCKKRQPFASTNSRIPGPSRLVQPRVMAKRLATDAVVSVGKENEPKAKKPRLEATGTCQPKVVTEKRGLAAGSSSSARPKLVQKPQTKTEVASSKFAGKSVAKTATARQPARPTKNASAGSSSSGKVGGGGGGAKAKKRPPWDLKGRVQDMEEERKQKDTQFAEMNENLKNLLTRMETLENEKAQDQQTIEQQVQKHSEASTAIRNLKQQAAGVQRKLNETTREYEHKLEMISLSKATLQRSHDLLQGELDSANTEVNSLKTTVKQVTADASGIKCQLEATKISRDRALEDCIEKDSLIRQLQEEILSQAATINDCHEKLLDEERVRRTLHNSIQELKGNIRVFCRVRPLLSGEEGFSSGGGGGEEGEVDAATAVASFNDSTVSMESVSSTTASSSSHSRRHQSSASSLVPPPPLLKLDYPDLQGDGRKLLVQYISNESSAAGKGRNVSSSYDFDFDHVFGPGANQQHVFEEISQLVQSALDGYNVCIFAYGQTGSGKTYTMEGLGSDRGGDRGMIPRTVEQVFQAADALVEKGWKYEMESSFVEIYNETLRDLLVQNGDAGGRNGGGGESSKLEIKKHPIRTNDMLVTNLTVTKVISQSQVSSLLERAAKNRAVAATLCNERSSRSHSVFRLRLSGNNANTGESCEGMLNLVDLAGSERLSNSGSVGERLKETKNINKSLSNLGNVIMALANKEQHIPYRNSKLTYLLQNSLGGNSKTLMFVNVSPNPLSFQETICSLRFATKVNQCNIGTARKVVK